MNKYYENAIYNNYIVKNSLLINLTGGGVGLPPGPSDAPPMLQTSFQSLNSTTPNPSLVHLLSGST